jgi:hypothetical protein
MDNKPIGVTTEFILAAVPAILAEIVKQRSAMRDVTSKSLNTFMKATTKDLLEECSRKDNPPTPMQCLKVDLEEVVEKLFAEIRETIKYELRLELLIELESMVSRIAQPGSGSSGVITVKPVRPPSAVSSVLRASSDVGSSVHQRQSADVMPTRIETAPRVDTSVSDYVPALRGGSSVARETATREPSSVSNIRSVIAASRDASGDTPKFSTQPMTEPNCSDLSKNPLYERVCKNLDRMGQGKSAYDAQALIDARGSRFGVEEAKNFLDRAEELNDYDEDEGDNSVWDKLMQMRSEQ